jgi:hypothetical protein
METSAGTRSDHERTQIDGRPPMAADEFNIGDNPLRFHAKLIAFPYEHSEQARAPHTNGPRDVPRFGALSLLQKTLK